jgi:parvulin-like peptidyl-prolyl isomerase
VAEAVFAAQSGDVVGPVDVDGWHHVVRVERVQRAELTPGIHAAVRDHLFTEWVRERADQAGVELTLPALLSAAATH